MLELVRSRQKLCGQLEEARRIAGKAFNELAEMFEPPEPKWRRRVDGF